MVTVLELNLYANVHCYLNSAGSAVCLSSTWLFGWLLAYRPRASACLESSLVAAPTLVTFILVRFSIPSRFITHLEDSQHRALACRVVVIGDGV